ncbi:MAG: hypothetical protein DHS20C17_26980 [Cyclobacteriaceae bacterium]|nr:MAG: hypothetical protein DHS20C17_26980 [Cyclobacteriaceae bacterium]
MEKGDSSIALFRLNFTTCKCPEKLKILFSMVEVNPPNIITEISITAKPMHMLTVAMVWTVALKLFPLAFNLLDI